VQSHPVPPEGGYVSIQLVSPASGETAVLMALIPVMPLMAVSIQLVSPASGDGVSNCIIASVAMEILLFPFN